MPDEDEERITQLEDKVSNVHLSSSESAQHRGKDRSRGEGTRHDRRRGPGPNDRPGNSRSLEKDSEDREPHNRQRRRRDGHQNVAQSGLLDGERAETQHRRSGRGGDSRGGRRSNDIQPSLPHIQPDPLLSGQIARRRKAGEEMRLVVDASAWLFGLPVLKTLLKRDSELVVPLECLRTLDLLKKGMHPVAINARTASRFIEGAQRRTDKKSTRDPIEGQPGLPGGFQAIRPGVWIQNELETVHTQPIAEADVSASVPPSFVQSTLGCALYFRSFWDTPPGKPVLAIAVPSEPIASMTAASASHPVPGSGNRSSVKQDNTGGLSKPSDDISIIIRFADRADAALITEWAEKGDILYTDVNVIDAPSFDEDPDEVNMGTVRLASLEDDPRAELEWTKGRGSGRGGRGSRGMGGHRGHRGRHGLQSQRDFAVKASPHGSRRDGPPLSLPNPDKAAASMANPRSTRPGDKGTTRFTSESQLGEAAKASDKPRPLTMEALRQSQSALAEAEAQKEALSQLREVEDQLRVQRERTRVERQGPVLLRRTGSPKTSIEAPAASSSAPKVVLLQRPK